jgi:hypothetical protein
MISEYLSNEYGKVTTMTGVPLGKISSTLTAEVGVQKAIAMLRPYRPEVDAIAVLPKHLVLIEAKVWNIVNGLAKLPMYKSLVEFTPELRQYLPREIIMELVVGWTNDNLQIMASAAGIRVKVYSPDWLKEVVDDMHKYWTIEYRAKRQDILNKRELYGLE